MGDDFTFQLSGPEKEYLINLARLSIGRRLQGSYEESGLPPPPPGRLQEPLGAFVTLKKQGRLRGCIGRLVGDAPLFLTVSRMALAAAFQDHRFPPLAAGEFAGLEYEVSVMGPILPCHDPEQVEIGRHGLIMKQGGRQGLLLPQVPVEWKWNREEFLAQTCVKAGLPPQTWLECWKKNNVELYWFEALVIEEAAG